MLAKGDRGTGIRGLAHRWRHFLLPVPVLFVPLLIGVVGLFQGPGWRDKLLVPINQWTGGKATLSGPLSLGLFPPEIRARGFVLTGGNLPMVERIEAEKAAISFSFWQLFLGRVTIGDVALHKPRIVIDASRATVRAADTAAILSGVPFETLVITDGRLSISDAEGAGYALTALGGRFNFNGANGLSGNAQFSWRDEPVRVSFKGHGIETGEAGRVPLRASIESEPLRVLFDGDVSLADTFAATGTVEVASPSLRKLLRWAGHGAPEGQSLRDFDATGTLAWSGATLAIDEGRFKLDGNAAEGALAVTLGQRPFVQGTLAFETLDLTPYIDRHLLARLEAPLAHHFDVDFRISAVSVGAPDFHAGEAAGTLNVRSGSVVVELAEASLCGGSASGRVRLDVAQSPARLVARGDLRGVDTNDCLARVIDNPGIGGRGDIAFDVAGRGRDASELAASLHGIARARAESGYVAIDLQRLLAQARSRDLSPVELGGQTAFSRLSVDCGLTGGKAVCDTLEMTTAIGVVKGGVQLDMAALELNGAMTLEQSALSASASARGVPPGVERHAFLIGGSWDMPEIEPTQRPAVWPKRPPNLQPVRRQSRLEEARWRR